MASCKDGKNETDTVDSVATVKQREKAVSKKEKSLEIKENELATKEAYLDSMLRQIDTTGIYNSKIIGDWTLKMLCTETSCTGSAIGDTRTEQWNFSYQENRVLVHSSLNKKPLRDYSGLYKGTSLILAVKKINSTDASIYVRLFFTNDNKMEGRREVTQEDGCKIVYTLEAERI
jgi:hypothetical protein